MSAKMTDAMDGLGKPVEITDPFARRLIGKYLDNRKDDIGKLTKALADSDFDAIRLTGHNLYGSGAAYGLDRISLIGASIEKAADAKDAPGIELAIEELSQFIHGLKVL
jgi:HPt (histidine-containing phosphotransfer) domain-containing protein